MNKNLIFSAKDPDAVFYAKLLAKNSCGSFNNDINNVFANDFIKARTIVWVSSIANASISGFSEFSDHWDNLRYKNLVFVLVGKAPADHIVYKQIWSNNAAPTMKEKIHFFAVQDLRKDPWDGIPLIASKLSKFKISLNNVCQCVGLLGG